VSIETLPAMPPPETEDTSEGSSAVVEPDSEPASTDAHTESATEPAPVETTAGEPDDSTTTETSDTSAVQGGCGAAIPSAALLTLMAVVGVATVCVKKKED
jgi:hypothetical protein